MLQKCADVYGIKLSSLILLSESYEEAVAKGRGTAMIRSLMMGLINKLSTEEQEDHESET